ncbi:ADP-ribosyltransferase 1, isoform CRA_d [Mus musculus]|nr:ADP-ribosyltransferase 1, isoform CRA_d [Mus musculus]
MKIPAMMSLLLVSVGLRDGVQVQSYSISQLDIFSQETPLDMAPASFDDQYAGCLADMTAALPDLNHSEFHPTIWRGHLLRYLDLPWGPHQGLLLFP